MLLQIRNYIAQSGTVSSQQLTREFRIDWLALKPMLDIWVKKGVIEQLQQVVACGAKCFKCQPIEFYQLSR